MASALAKATLAAITATIVTPILARIDALKLELAAPAVPPAVEPPPVTAPDPAPPVVTPDPVPATSGCVVTVTSAAGAAWRWDATAAAAQDALGLRAMTEVPAEIAGVTSLRLVADLGAGWAVVAPRNDAAMREGAGEARYSLRVELDGRVVLDKSYIVQPFATGEIYVLGKEPFWPLPATAALIDQGLVARYVPGPVGAEKLKQWAATMAAPDWQAPGSARGITQYMPGTGGREDIGPTTTAAAGYLASRSQIALDYLIGQAEAAARVPWHLWDAEHGSWLSADHYPRVWTDGRGATGGPGKPGDREARGLTVQLPQTGWTLDTAHQPSLSYVAYLLTGRRAFLDNLQAQAVYSIHAVWTHDPLRGPAGVIVVDGGQVRDSAWALRQIDEAAAASPAGSPEKAYFERASKANWAWLVEQLPAWTAKQGEAHGRIEGGYGTPGALPPWQQHYFVSTAAAAARRGNADARTVLAWMRNFVVGSVQHLGRDAPAYLLMVEDATTWADIKARTEAAGWANGDGWVRSDGVYGQIAIFALRSIADVLDDAEAAECAKWLIAEGAPYTAPADYVKDPTWRIEVGR